MGEKKLFLDDVRQPWEAFGIVPDKRYTADGWHVVRTYCEFEKWIRANGLPDFVSFDHDLGDLPVRGSRENNGYHAAKLLAAYCYSKRLKLPEYAVHSMNPVGKKNITDYLEWARTKLAERAKNTEGT